MLVRTTAEPTSPPAMSYTIRDIQKEMEQCERYLEIEKLPPGLHRKLQVEKEAKKRSETSASLRPAKTTLRRIARRGPQQQLLVAGLKNVRSSGLFPFPHVKKRIRKRIPKTNSKSKPRGLGSIRARNRASRTQQKKVLVSSSSGREEFSGRRENQIRGSSFQKTRSRSGQCIIKR